MDKVFHFPLDHSFRVIANPDKLNQILATQKTENIFLDMLSTVRLLQMQDPTFVAYL